MRNSPCARERPTLKDERRERERPRPPAIPPVSENLTLGYFFAGAHRLTLALLQGFFSFPTSHTSLLSRARLHVAGSLKGRVLANIICYILRREKMTPLLSAPGWWQRRDGLRCGFSGRSGEQRRAAGQRRRPGGAAAGARGGLQAARLAAARARRAGRLLVRAAAASRHPGGAAAA